MLLSIKVTLYKFFLEEIFYPMNSSEAILEPTAFVDVVPEDDVHPMALLLEEIENSLLELKVGDIRSGIIVEKRSNELLVDIGFKSEGFVSGREIDRIRDMFDSIEIGDEIPVYILREEKDGSMMLSISRALAEQDWQRSEELLESQEMFEGEVTGHNRGGIIVKFGQVRGFVPASQLATTNRVSAKPSQDPNDDGSDRYSHMVGMTLMLKVIDLDRKRNRLILSERLAMREWRRQQKEKLLAALKEGESFDGVISSVADFGAFVDLGGADGLIHLSELSWNRVSHPSEVVSVGQKVKVQILSVDLDRKRIGLSLRRLQPHPWDVVHENYEVGSIVQGKITKLVNFGAFARLEPDGIEGLIHISELSNERVAHPKDIVSEGQKVDLRIIRIDTAKRRMGLSLKQALPAEEVVEIDWQIAPSSEPEDEEPSEVAAQVASIIGAVDDDIDNAENSVEVNETVDEATEDTESNTVQEKEEQVEEQMIEEVQAAEAAD